MSRVYDEVNRVWTYKPDKKDTKKENTGNTTNDSSGMSSPNSSSDSATGETAKEVNRITLRTLSGNLTLVPTDKSIKLKAGDTITLSGLGKYLSGKYYVESVEKVLSTSGFSQSATVLKTNFRETLKIVAKYPDEKSKLKAYETIYKKNVSKYKSSHKGTSNLKIKSHIVKKKETLYTISRKYFKSTKYAKNLAKINGNLPTKKWTRLPVGYKLIIAKK